MQPQSKLVQLLHVAKNNPRPLKWILEALLAKDGKDKGEKGNGKQDMVKRQNIKWFWFLDFRYGQFEMPGGHSWGNV